MDEHIQREIDRARRFDWPLTAIVVRASQIELAAQALRVGLRSYDLIERNRDELLCIAAPLTEDAARRRLIEISVVAHEAELEAGVAELHGPELAAEVVERARDDLNRRTARATA